MSELSVRGSNGKISDVYLIERNGSELLYDVLIKATKEDAVKLSAEAINVLKANSISENIAAKVGVALEEMTVNLVKHNSGKYTVNLDIRIINSGSNIIIALSDDGKAFNLLEYAPEESKDYQFDEVMVLKAIAKDIQYNRVLSLNQTIIEIGGSNEE